MCKKVIFTTRLIVFILLLLFENATIYWCSSVPNIQPGQLDQFTSVGIFSICKDSINQTQFNKNAEDIKGQIEILLDNQDFKVRHFIDVCQNHDRVLESMVQFFLDERFYFPRSTGTEHRHEDSENDVVRQSQKIVYLVGLVHEEFAKTIKSFVGISPTLFLCYPMGCDNRFELSTVRDYSKILLKFAYDSRWFNLAFILVRVESDAKDIYQKYFEDSYSLFREEGAFCVARKTFYIDNSIPFYEGKYETFLEFVKNRINKDSIIILFVQKYYQNELLISLMRDKSSNITDKTFIAHDKPLCHHGYCDPYKNKRGNYWILYDGSRLKHNKEFAAQNHSELKNNIAEITSTISYPHILDGNNIANNLHQAHINFIKRHKREFIFPLNYHRYIYGDEMIDNHIVSTESEQLLREKHRSPTFCPTVICPPGQEKVHGNIQVAENNDFDAISGFKCRLCPSNTIKAGNGDGPCKRCDGKLSADNGLRTLCEDPFTNKSLSLDYNMKYTILGLIGIGAFLATTFLILFIVKRSTPIVRISDVYLALSHLTIELLSFISCFMFYVVFSTHTRYVCIGRNLILSVLYTSNIALVYIKSFKLINAFSSNVKLGVNAVKKTTSAQVFTVIVSLFVINSCLVVLYIQRSPDPEYIRDDVKLVRVHHCSVFHENSLIVIIIVYQLVCLVQAFRGRNLPSIMNDAMAMVYAIFIITVSFVVTFPIAHFQGPKHVEFVRLTVLLLNNLVLIVFLYGKKCFIIVFRPQENTKQKFQKQRMEEISRQVKFNQ